MKIKRLTALLLIMTIAVCFFAEFPVSAASNPSINLTSIPSTITLGNSFHLTGTVTSSYPITAFSGYIYDSWGYTVDSESYNPSKNGNVYTVDIKSSNVNQYLSFGSLNAGEYTLYLCASNSNGGSVPFTTHFTVVPASSKPVINVTSYPGTIKQGSIFNLCGSVTSKYAICSLDADIYRSNGSYVTGSGYCPNATTVDIRSSYMNQYLSFGSLSAGNYILKITAENKYGESNEWSHPFTVEPSRPLSINLTSSPVRIAKNSSFNLTGTVSSGRSITYFSGYIKDSNGIQLTGASCYPNSTSVEIQPSAVNQNLRFGRLAAGKYTLVLYAVDTSGASCSVYKNFTVY